MENNSDIDKNQSVRDMGGSRGIQMDVATEVERIIQRKIDKDDNADNTKRILTNIVGKTTDPLNLEAVNLRKIDREKKIEKP